VQAGQGDEIYSLKELCSLADVSERTVRYYITEGLLPPSHGSGLAAGYSRWHLLVLLAIRQLKNQYLPLSEIKQRLARYTLAELEAIASQHPRQPTKENVQTYTDKDDSALDYLNQLRVRHKFNKSLQSEQNDEPKSLDPTNEPIAEIGWPPVKAQSIQPSQAETPAEEEGENWRRVKLAEETELHYRFQPGNPAREAKIKRLLELAHQLFQ
jgi:DNA-binding transcriptional MerR regulator